MIANVGGILDTFTEFANNFFYYLDHHVFFFLFTRTPPIIYADDSTYSGIGPFRQPLLPYQGLLKKAASGVRAIFPCSRASCTLRSQK